MRTRHTTVRIGVGFAAVAALAAVLVYAWTVGLPWSANHFGFALPGDTDGMPYRIHYNGRSYATHGLCARASWCEGELHADIMKDTLVAEGAWPLTRVTSLSTLLGAPHPVLAHMPPAGMTTMVLYIPDGPDRYIAYTIEGGP